VKDKSIIVNRNGQDEGKHEYGMGSEDEESHQQEHDEQEVDF